MATLGDLFAATEAVGDDQGFWCRLADGGHQFQFAYCYRDAVLFFFEAEGAGHAAASGGWGLVVDVHLAEDGFFVGHLH